MHLWENNCQNWNFDGDPKIPTKTVVSKMYLGIEVGYSRLRNLILNWKVLAENVLTSRSSVMGRQSWEPEVREVFRLWIHEAAPWHKKNSVNAIPFRIEFWDWLTLVNDIRENFNESTVFAGAVSDLHWNFDFANFVLNDGDLNRKSIIFWNHASRWSTSAETFLSDLILGYQTDPLWDKYVRVCIYNCRAHDVVFKKFGFLNLLFQKRCTSLHFVPYRTSKAPYSVTVTTTSFV